MLPRRQKIRKFLLILSALLFPVTMIYFSPGMVFRGARTGVLSGSYITFGLLFLSALLFGRGFCGWICPGGGFGEVFRNFEDSPFKNRKWDKIKYGIWVIWITAIAAVVIFAGKGFHSIDPFLGTDRGISIHSLTLYGFYYLVIGVILVSSLLAGRRGFCHTLCWMAPFMILGRKFRNLFKWKSLSLQRNRSATCTGCRLCESHCPMSLPVAEMVAEDALENCECILCGACEDNCPQKVLKIGFDLKKKRHQDSSKKSRIS